MGAYFHTVLKPRITKVIYSPDWKDGKAQTHGKGMSALELSGVTVTAEPTMKHGLGGTLVRVRTPEGGGALSADGSAPARGLHDLLRIVNRAEIPAAALKRDCS